MKSLFIVLLMLGQKFYADDPVRQDNDARVDAANVARLDLNDHADFLQQTFLKPGDRTKRPARNANTLGDVPDSSWFQNRHGMFPMSLAELVRGPNTGDGPSAERPWHVIAVKTEGITPGLRIRDAQGDVYIIKFDSPGNPELATAAEVISTKFFYAMGFNVPENYLAFFRREDVQVDPNGTFVDSMGRERRLTEADLNQILERAFRPSNGTYRVLASKLLDGVPAGPFQYFGTRSDDPNDIFDHEDRRELRGLRVLSSWLNHTDTKANNTLDVVVGKEGNRHLRHYLIDFGSTLGSGGVGPKAPRFGSEYIWEPKRILGRAVTLGMWDRGWVTVKSPRYLSIGRFESRRFRPEEWKSQYPNPAFEKLADEDAYWAAKIVMSFSDEEIRAIVKTGELTDPEAEAYLVKTLIERRDKINRTWLNRLSSFDRFQLSPEGGLKFEHLASRYGFAARPEFRLTWFYFDNSTGEWQSIDDFRADRTYFVGEILSAEGTVLVYVRRVHGSLQIVGIERQFRRVSLRRLQTAATRGGK